MEQGASPSGGSEPPLSAAENDPLPHRTADPSGAPLGPPRREGEVFSDSGPPLPAAEEEPSAWDSFVNAVTSREGLQTGYDAIGGAIHGASSGFADDALDLLPGEMGDESRAQMAQSEARSPRAFAVGDAVGSFLSPVNKIAKGVGLAGGAAKNIAGQALEGGIQGVARTFGDAEDLTGETALRALAQGGEDMVQSGGAAALLSGAGRASGRIAKALGNKADMNRAASAGFYGSSLERLGDNKGDEYVAQLGRRMEEEGLHRGRAPGGMINPLNWVPQNAGTIAKNAGELGKRSGDEMALAEAEIGRLDAQPQVDVSGTIARQGVPVRGSDVDPVAGDAENAFRGRFADRMSELAPDGQMPMLDALDRRRYLDDQINWSKKEGYEGAGMQEQVRRDVANDLRGGISDSLQGAASRGDVDPELAQQWERGRGNFELSSDVNDAARSRAMREQGNQLMSLPTHALVGGALGGATGYGSSDGDWSDTAMSAMAAGAAGQLLKTRGRAGLAGMQRGASKVIGSGRAAQWAGENAALGSMASLDAGGTMPDNGDDALRTMGEQLSKNQQEARGYLLPQAVQQALQSDPGILGPYAQTFFNAQDEDEIQVELDRLSRTDQTFATRVLPRLNQMTAER
ncbi:MAG: hypothetical protein JXB36_02935 [Gammaproteobacteria bacterium]|nr:hypothetical protein [Gammaproteobacteria bacterium]